MILREIVRALERIEQNQAAILERLKALESDGGEKDDRWLQSGIDNILNYQVGKKREV